MEAKKSATDNAPVPTGRGRSSNGEFIVHTKHTCDVCYTTPILGKRFTSTVHANYDVCAKCFDNYDGPEIGLTEAVLTRDKKYSRDFVLKLKINNGGDEQTRRIQVADIWGKSTAHLSFGKMVAIASKNANAGDDAALAAFKSKAKVTYIDDDGDKITITTDKELEDAFLQTLQRFPQRIPFRVTVNIPKEGDDEPKNINNKFIKTPPHALSVKRAGTGAASMKREASQKAAQERVNRMIHISPPCQGFATNVNNENLFVHARHTCDGCSKTPIVGTRYHATKIPNFDLCGACFEKYEGEEADFKPEVADRDRCMQRRWMRKQQRRSHHTMPCVGSWNKNKEGLADFLKRVQETGATIESATVLVDPPAAEPASTKKPEPTEEMLTAKCEWGGDATPQEVPEVVKVESTDENSSAEAKVESPSVEEEVPDSSSPAQEKSKAAPTEDKAPASPTMSHDESFLSDADGNGSIAEAIGRTLDVCVAAIEEAMDDVAKVNAGLDGSNKEKSDGKASVGGDVATAAAIAVDTFSVASSMVSSMTDILKKMDDAAKKGEEVMSESNITDSASANVPSMVTSATIVKSEDGADKDEEEEEMTKVPKVEDVSDGEDEWSVVSDDKAQTKPDFGNLKSEEESLSSALSPVVLAKWDTELHQLHELGFFDDRKNVDVLEALEASHVAVDSEEKVTVQNAVEHLLG